MRKHKNNKKKEHGNNQTPFNSNKYNLKFAREQTIMISLVDDK